MQLLPKLDTSAHITNTPDKSKKVQLFKYSKLRQNSVNFAKETQLFLTEKQKESPIIYGIIRELKYRVLYIGLAIMSLLGFVYLNLGLYIEFQGSYYLNYYQSIDFNWYESVKELNQSVVTLTSRDASFPETLHKMQSPFGGTNSSLKALNKHVIGAQLLYPKQELLDFKTGYLNSVANANLQSVRNYKLSHGTFEHGSWNNSKPSNIEIDEFKNFFISTVSYFSGQMKLFLDFSEGNKIQLLEKQGYSQQLLFSIYMISIFYQLTALLGYHCFCFLGPATLKQSRLKLFRGLQILFNTLLLHFLALPYVVTVYEELQIENIDSELFFSVSFNLLNSWVHCFYFLLVTLAFVLMFFFFKLWPKSSLKSYD
uniref:SecY-independant transporter protein n=1 Tax=Tupiella akineta TaxID=160070 RepID=Q6UVR2_TUPAK|nr:SecY-independant transporter protein [Tupiella akineta]AAQ18762.1 SecY-independant transporter protein [Tupiella akineta]